MVTIQHRNNVPPGGGWIYIQPESGMAFKHPDLMHVKRMVKAHRIANNYPVGVNFDQEIEESICNSRPELCFDNTPLADLTFFERVAKFASASIQWAASGFKVVNSHQYNQRLATCQQCEKWHGEKAFGLGQCGSCGCSGVKLFMVTEKCPLNKWSAI
jgi:hypothetical protein